MTEYIEMSIELTNILFPGVSLIGILVTIGNFFKTTIDNSNLTKLELAITSPSKKISNIFSQSLTISFVLSIIVLVVLLLNDLISGNITIWFFTTFFFFIAVISFSLSDLILSTISIGITFYIKEGQEEWEILKRVNNDALILKKQ